MKNKLKSFFTFKSLIIPLILMALIPVAAFADAPVAPVDFAAVVMALWQAIQNHASTALLLVPVFQLLRTSEVAPLLGWFSGKYLQVVIAIITAIGFVINAWATGQALGQAAITGLFTSGGAMLIYDAIRSIQPPAPTPVPVVAPAAPAAPAV